jgi:adenine-specific DNA-methyltransferase
VTIVMNTAGSMSPGLFSRSDEYAYFCFFGDAAPCKMETDLLAESKPVAQHWFPLFRSRGLNDRPSKRPNLVYPIEVDRETRKIVGAGPSLKDRLDSGESLGDLDAWRPPANDTLNGNPVVWPILDSGEVTTWQVSPTGLTQLIANGYVRVRDPKQPGPRPFTLSYIKSGTQKQVESGDLSIEGHDESGAVILSGGARTTIPKTTWKVASHDARLYGTTMLRSLLGTTAFTYPKSPYAVVDTLKSIVGDNPNALIVDFFAGSGTTLQAVSILNRLDEGQRRCVLVTNNEVPNDAAVGLREKGLSPGDAEWEANGIAQAVTMPRVTACLTGRRPDNELVEGDYIDGTPISEGLEESAVFFELTYLDRNDVSRGKSFEAIAPLLWMKVGARGEMIAKQKANFAAPANARYAVLFDIDAWPKFVDELRGREDLEHVFIVTDSLAMYQQVVAELPAELETTMLYEDYLRNFEINMGGVQ